MEAEVKWKSRSRNQRQDQTGPGLDATGKEHHDQNKEPKCFKKRTQRTSRWYHVRQHTIPEELNNKELNGDEHEDYQKTDQKTIKIG